MVGCIEATQLRAKLQEYETDEIHFEALKELFFSKSYFSRLQPDIEPQKAIWWRRPRQESSLVDQKSGDVATQVEILCKQGVRTWVREGKESG